MRFSRHATFLVVLFFLLSLGGSWVLFEVLDAVATGEWLEFKLGGSAAGFAVLFLMLRHSYERLASEAVVRVRLDFGDEVVPTGGTTDLDCSYTIFNRGSLDQHGPEPVELLQEGSSYVFYVESQSNDDLISVELRGDDGRVWRSNFEGLHVTPLVVERT